MKSTKKRWADIGNIKPPEKVELLQHGSHIEIVYKWFEWRIVVLTPFVIGANWMVLKFFWIGSDAPIFQFLSPTLFLVFQFVFTTLFAWLAYYSVAGWVNRSHICISRDEIVVRHGSVPWPGNKVLKVGNIKQLYKQTMSTGPRGNPYYEVRALTADDNRIKLVRVSTGEQALYIEEVIELYLGIKETRESQEQGDPGQISSSQHGSPKLVVSSPIGHAEAPPLTEAEIYASFGRKGEASAISDRSLQDP